ncbi:MAG: STAS/SEC14 domain-containing protein, partial [Hyphomonas sp.]
IMRVHTERSDLLVFEIVEKIRTEDMAWMVEQVSLAFEKTDHIDLMLIMTNFKGVEAGAMLRPDAMGVTVKSLWNVRKYCVAGAPSWARAMIEIFKWVTPVDEKTFSLSELDEAWHWVGGEQLRRPV